MQTYEGTGEEAWTCSGGNPLPGFWLPVFSAACAYICDGISGIEFDLNGAVWRE